MRRGRGRVAYGAYDAAVAFLDVFANRPAGFGSRALAVLDKGPAGSDSPVSACNAGWLLPAHELPYWDALAEWL